MPTNYWLTRKTPIVATESNQPSSAPTMNKLTSMALLLLASQMPLGLAQELPTGFAVSDLGLASDRPVEDGARSALIKGSLTGGAQGGFSQAPTSVMYVVLSVFMGGADAPRDLTLPAESVK